MVASAGTFQHTPSFMVRWTVQAADRPGFCVTLTLEVARSRGSSHAKRRA